MGCPVEPIPIGWRVWRSPVPAELSAFAKQTLANVNAYPYGSIAATTVINGVTVGAFKSHHTWTFRGGQLVTGLCIPGISLLWQPDTAAYGLIAQDSLATPDPNAAVFVVDDAIGSTDWRLVALSAAAIVTISILFALALQHAGRAAAH
jgi:hypothetical protein